MKKKSELKQNKPGEYTYSADMENADYWLSTDDDDETMAVVNELKSLIKSIKEKIASGEKLPDELIDLYNMAALKLKELGNEDELNDNRAKAASKK